MILIIDNYDSFTLNLAEYFHRLGMATEVIRNDEPFNSFLEKEYQGVVISPGPQLPKNANHLLKLIKHFEQTLPILGICLGHQAITEFYGGTLKKLSIPQHGKQSLITLGKDPLFHSLPHQISVVRYHSWEVETLPQPLLEIARSNNDDSIMAIKHLSLPIYGIQFHPESILTESGIDILKNWLIVNGIS